MFAIRYSHPMKTFRIVVAILAIVPLALLIDLFFFQLVDYEIGELLYLIVGVPILTLNYWAWFEPVVIELYFFGKDIDQSQTS